MGGVADFRLPEGGLGAVSEALARAAQAQVARPFAPAAPVARITLEGDRVSGVELESGERLAAGIVVSNADPASTLLQLLGARHLETGFVHRVRHLRAKGMAAKLHLALDGLPAFTRLQPELAGERLVIAPDRATSSTRSITRSTAGAPPSLPSKSRFRRVHDSTLAPSGKHVLSAIVQYAPYDPRASGDHSRAAFLERTLAVLERYAPGLRSQITRRNCCCRRTSSASSASPAGIGITASCALDQFLMLRPVPGAAQYAMPVQRPVSVRRRMSSRRRCHGHRRRERGASGARSGARGMNHKEHFRVRRLRDAVPSAHLAAQRARTSGTAGRTTRPRTRISTKRSSTRRSATPARCSTSRR